jgi:hypothetical protein
MPTGSTSDVLLGFKLRRLCADDLAIHNNYLQKKNGNKEKKALRKKEGPQRKTPEKVMTLEMVLVCGTCSTWFLNATALASHQTKCGQDDHGRYFRLSHLLSGDGRPLCFCFAFELDEKDPERPQYVLSATEKVYDIKQKKTRAGLLLAHKCTSMVPDNALFSSEVQVSTITSWEFRTQRWLPVEPLFVGKCKVQKCEVQKCEVVVPLAHTQTIHIPRYT